MEWGWWWEDLTSFGTVEDSGHPSGQWRTVDSARVDYCPSLSFGFSLGLFSLFPLQTSAGGDSAGWRGGRCHEIALYRIASRAHRFEIVGVSRK